LFGKILNITALMDFFSIPVVLSGCGSEDTSVEEMIRGKAWSMNEASRTL
jgi:hypothetical protein